MCPYSHHLNGFVATHALGHIKYGYTFLVPLKQRVLKKLRKKCYSTTQSAQISQK